VLALQHPYVVVAPAETVHVEVWPGTGKPVAVIPGLFGASFTFRKVVPLLAAQGFRPIVIEPLGTGFSSARSRPTTPQRAVAPHRRRPGFAELGTGTGARALARRGDRISAGDRKTDLVRGIVSLEGGPTEEATTPTFRSAMRYLPWVKLLGGISLVRRKIRGMLLDSSGDPRG